MKKTLPYFAFFCIVITCIFSSECAQSAKCALDICLYTLLPSLFPFFVFARIFILSGGAESFSKKLAFLTKPLFNMSGNAAAPVILGVLCGYPIGAKSAAELYGEGAISKSEAQRLCGFCNNSGPLFLIGAVGCGMLSSPSAGYLLYAVHILSALTVGALFRGKYSPTLCSSKSSDICENIFVTAVEDSVTTLLNVFGYVIIFSVVTAFFKNPFLIGIFEITNAISKISASDFPLYQKFIFAAVLSSWGGVCVHMQTFGILSKYKLSFKKYLFSKLIHAFIAFVYAVLAIKIIPVPFKTFSSSFEKYASSLNFASLVCIIILGIYLFYLNIIIIKNNAEKHGGKAEKKL